MELTKLNGVLHEDAKMLNACDKVMGHWTHDLTLEELIDMFIHNQEFCIEKEFPSLPFIVSNFPSEMRKAKGVYINEDIMLRGKSGIIVIGGNTKGLVMADGFDAATLYVRHNADITVSAKMFAKLFIHIYDSAKVNVTAEEPAKIYVYAHGNDYKLTRNGNVVIRNK